MSRCLYKDALSTAEVIKIERDVYHVLKIFKDEVTTFNVL
jgi:hypothetical protein